MKNTLFGLLLLALAAGSVPARAGGGHRLGIGANYWTALDDVDVSDVDKDGFSYLLTYQYRFGFLLGLQVDLEALPDRFGEDAYAPAAYLLLGDTLYAAAGMGMVRQGGSWSDDPFYALKAGLNLNVLPLIHLDLSVSYRWDRKTKLDDALDAIDTDTLFLGASLRLGF